MSDYELNPSFDSGSPSGMYIPANIDDCIRELNKILPAGLIEEIRLSAEGDLVKYHFGLGIWLRNNWGLWVSASRLKQYFNELGVSDADDMASIILVSYWEFLQGLPANVSRQIVYKKISRDEIRSGCKPSNLNN